MTRPEGTLGAAETKVMAFGATEVGMDSVKTTKPVDPTCLMLTSVDDGT